MASKELIEKELAANLKRGADLVEKQRLFLEEAMKPVRAMLNASPLGEQSDRAEIISADGAIWDETAPGSRNFKRREQSE